MFIAWRSGGVVGPMKDEGGEEQERAWAGRASDCFAYPTKWWASGAKNVPQRLSANCTPCR